MSIFLCFLLPLAAYFALYFFAPRQLLGRFALWGAVAVALISSTAVVFVTRSSTHWPEDTQVAWTGVSVADGKPLVMGGAREEAVVGWPNDSFDPYLKVTTDGTAAALEIKGGGAFVRDDLTESYLNGVALSSGEPRAFGEHSIRLSSDFSLADMRLRFWGVRVEILDSEGLVAGFSLPRAGKDRVYALSDFVEKFARAEPSGARRVNAATKWGAERRLLVTADGEVRLLDRQPTKAQCTLPCSLSLLWSGTRQPVRLSQGNEALELEFLPPWRRSSPLPPQGEGGQRRLTVTGLARPNDYAFLLPFGNGIGDPRASLPLRNVGEAGPTFVGDGGAGRQAPPQAELPAEILPPSPPRLAGIGGQVPRARVKAGSNYFVFSGVKNLPKTGEIVLLLAVALLCYGAGLGLAWLRMPSGVTRWAVYGLAAFLWDMLALRLLLALRYAYSPAHLDDLGVKGVTVAFAALTVIPGLVLLVARLRSDLSDPVADGAARKATLMALGQIGVLLVGLFFMYHRVPKLWNRDEGDWWFELPAWMVTRMGVTATLFFAAAAAYLLLTALVLYRSESDREKFPLLWAVFVGPLTVVEYVLGKSRTLWAMIADPHRSSMPRLRSLFALVAILFALTPLALGLIGRRFFQDVGAPLLFCWPFAAFWLASKVSFRVGRGEDDALPSPRFVLVAAALTIVPPVFALPVVIRDSGSVLAGLVVFTPLAFLLLTSRPRRLGLVALGTLGTVFLLASLTLYSNLLFYIPGASQLVGEANVRLLSFRQGTTIQRTILVAERDEDGPRGLPMQKLRNAYEHTREMEAIAHEGGWLGVGFANAPTRRSQIRQDTLQYDSVFGFFVVSEYGLVGGMALLLLYAFPLALVLASAKARFDFGHGIAALVAGSLLLEALLHAGMNLGAFPFTGRNLPLLSVISNTDLPRWTLLCLLALLGLFARHGGAAGYTKDSASIISETAGDARLAEEPRRPFVLGVSLLVLTHVLLGASVAYHAVRVLRDPALDRPVGWDETLAAVRRLITEERIYVDHQSKEIKFKEDSLNVMRGDFIAEERERFNALPAEEKVGEVGLGDFMQRLRETKGLEEYGQLLGRLRWLASLDEGWKRASLFRLSPTYDGLSYRVEPNPDFNTQVSFGVSLKPEDCPRVIFRDDDRRPVIGPAWVMGEWFRAYDPDAGLPWVETLASALDAEWKQNRSQPAEVNRRYGTLSLRRGLQDTAAKFAAARGGALYQRLLEENEKAGGREAVLPPRVGLTIMGLPDGEVLALGGWPRMAPGRLWRRGDGKSEWIPPAEWVTTTAPRSIERRYGSDRNFDLVVVGSATKPLWASAVLSLHPGIERLLRVRGADELEGDIFGIRIAGEPETGKDDQRWRVVPREEWVDFKNYLALSDNRYHLRLGFLGLAEEIGAGVRPAGESPSVKESMDGKNAWGRVPAFPATLLFSARRGDAIANLHTTHLARALRSMFAVPVATSESARRVSFWTKDQHDDFGRAQQGRGWPTPLFDSISPAPVNLGLDAIKTPRDFVSVLFGGKTNLWGNVDLAAAFATSLGGRPVVPHITANDVPVVTAEDREPFAAVAARLRPGLEAVVHGGTATADLRQSGALEFLTGLKGYKLYAKTGTLQAEKGEENTSRLVLAIVRWDDEAAGRIGSGLVFSVFGERADERTATRWLSEFIVQNRDEIRRLLEAGSAKR